MAGLGNVTLRFEGKERTLDELSRDGYFAVAFSEGGIGGVFGVADALEDNTDARGRPYNEILKFARYMSSKIRRDPVYRIVKLVADAITGVLR